MRYPIFSVTLLAALLFSTAASAQNNKQSDKSPLGFDLAERFDMLRRSLLGPREESSEKAPQRTSAGSRPTRSTQERTNDAALRRNLRGQESTPQAIFEPPAVDELAPQVELPPAVSDREQLRGDRAINTDARTAQRSRTSRRSNSPDRLLASSPAVSEQASVAEEPAEAAGEDVRTTEFPPAVTVEDQRPNFDESSEPPATVQPTENRATNRPSAEDQPLLARKNAILNVETLGPRHVVIGKPSPFRVKVENLSAVAASDVVVTVSIPAWAEVSRTDATRGMARRESGNAGSAQLVWQVGALEGNRSEELQLSVIPRKNEPFDLAVSWTAAPATSRTVIEVREPKVQLAIACPAEINYGETKAFRLTVSNPGTGDAENVTISLLPLDGGSKPAASHTIGNLAPGASQNLEVELTARQAGNLAITAIVTADGGLRTEATEHVLVRRAGLKLDVAGPKMKYAGTLATYAIQVSNPGNAPAKDIQVTAALPGGAEYLDSNDGGQHDAESGRIVWTLASLQPGGERNLEIKCTLKAPGSNVVQIVAEAAEKLSDSTVLTTDVEALSDLKLEVSDPPGAVPVGEDMVYEIKIKNRGTKAAEDVDVVAFFSDGIEAISVHGADHEIARGQVVFRPLASVPAGEEVVLKIVAAAHKPGNLVFRAEVECRTAGTRLAAEETTRFYEAPGKPINSTTRGAETSVLR